MRFDSESPYPLYMLSSMHRRRFRPAGSGLVRTVPGDMLCVVIRGQGLLRSDGDVQAFGEGQSFFWPASTKLELLPESAAVDCWLVTMRGVALDRRSGRWSVPLPAGVGPPPLSPLPPLRPPQPPPLPPPLPVGKLPARTAARPLAEQLERLHALYRTDRRRSAVELQLRFQALLQQLREELSGASEASCRGPGAGAGASAAGIEQSVAYMHDRYEEKIRLETLADMAGLTPTSFSRSFKKAKGISPIDYLNRVRIDRSKRLLDSACSVKQTAEAVGFGSEFYFSRLFKRSIGLPPSLYIRRRQLRIAVACCFRFEDCLHSLGVEPVAALNGWKYAQETMQQHQLRVKAQLESIVRARPDLILIDCRHGPYVERLQRIAPTVAIDYSADWRATYRKLAELAGREREAERSLGRIDGRIEHARRVLGVRRTDKTFSFMRLYRDTIRLQGQVNHPLNTLLYRELELHPGHDVPADSHYRVFDSRLPPPLETDYAFVCPFAIPEERQSLLSRLRLRGGPDGGWNGESDGVRIRVASNWIGKSWSPLGQSMIIDELLYGEM